MNDNEKNLKKYESGERSENKIVVG